MFKTLKNESGMVLLMVIMAVTVMMVFSIGVVSRGVSQTKSSEEQIDRIKGELLTQGAYAKGYSQRAAGMTVNAFTTVTATMDNKSYSVNVIDGGPTGPNNTNTLTLTAPF